MRLAPRKTYGGGMDSTARGGSTSDRAPGAGQVFVGDARLAVTALNEGRYFVLNRVLGVPREQANILTVALALAAADAAYATGRRVVRGPVPLSGSDATMGAMLIREGLLGIAGPAARKVPLGGTLLAVGLLGSVAAPELRQAIHRIRAAELRVRRQRMSTYAAAGRAASQRRDAAHGR
jgi:hypothetical protein